MLRILVRATVMLLALTGCSRREPRSPARSDTAVPNARSDSGAASPALRVPPSRAGHLVLAGTVLSFIPCDAAGSRITLQDMPNGDGAALVRAFRGGNGEVPALIRENGARLVEIRYAAPEGPDCTRLLSPFVLEARGNEPFWSVEIYGDSARLRVPLTPGGVVFNRGTWRRLSGGEWSYDARRGLAGGEEFLVVQVTEARCIDSMSGARYAFHASLIRDGEPARGCAVEGRLAMRR